jgi:nucleotide-binding universal stress UspA family protein
MVEEDILAMDADGDIDGMCGELLRREDYLMSEQMKILIAYDGSDCANAALADLQRAGLPRVAEALIMSVADVFLPPSSSPAPDLPAEVPVAVQRAWVQATHAVEEARALVQHARTHLLTFFPAWDVRAEACADSPAWAVVKKADTWQPDLIVVGSHGRSALGRLWLGSVSQKILTEARGSVRVGRSHHQTNAPSVRLLIGVDGSPDAAAAVRAVAAREWPAGSVARLVTALDPRMSTALAFMRLSGQTGTEMSEADESAWMSRTVDAMAAPLHERGLAVSSVIRAGDPKHVLLDEAEHWGADCLFVGARGLSRVERFLLGSVSAAVAARAPCSVEVVRLAMASLGIGEQQGRE